MKCIGAVRILHVIHDDKCGDQWMPAGQHIDGQSCVHVFMYACAWEKKLLHCAECCIVLGSVLSSSAQK